MRSEQIGGQFMTVISTIPDDTNLQLRATVVELLGNMSEWLSQYPQHIPAALNKLLLEAQVKLKVYVWLDTIDFSWRCHTTSQEQLAG